MPWTVGDVEKHIKGLSDKAKKVWVNVANSALNSCMEKGGSDCEASAIRQASSVAKKQMEDSDRSYNYLVDISDITLEEKDGKKTSWIEIFREGEWNHPRWGIIKGTKKLFQDFIDNWKNNVLGREISIDKTHNPSEGATGWIKDLKIFDDRLKAKVEWTSWGLDLIENKGFKYFSPEYSDNYINKETGAEVKNVLIGGALTLRPFLTNLNPVVLSEDMDVFQKYENNLLAGDDLKEEMWTALQDYANYDAAKIENITKAVKDYVKEAVNEMDKDSNKEIISNIIRTHLDSMMHELMNNMCWIKNYPPIELKSNH